MIFVRSFYDICMFILFRPHCATGYLELADAVADANHLRRWIIIFTLNHLYLNFPEEVGNQFQFPSFLTKFAFCNMGLGYILPFLFSCPSSSIPTLLTHSLTDSLTVLNYSITSSIPDYITSSIH